MKKAVLIDKETSKDQLETLRFKKNQVLLRLHLNEQEILIFASFCCSRGVP